LDQVDKLYIIDNSEKQNSPLFEKIRLPKKLEYVWNRSNLAFAAALNLGANRAINQRFDYLLTMDQDSEAYLIWL